MNPNGTEIFFQYGLGKIRLPRAVYLKVVGKS